MALEKAPIPSPAGGLASLAAINKRPAIACGRRRCEGFLRPRTLSCLREPRRGRHCGPGSKGDRESGRWRAGGQTGPGRARRRSQLESGLEELRLGFELRDWEAVGFLPGRSRRPAPSGAGAAGEGDGRGRGAHPARLPLRPQGSRPGNACQEVKMLVSISGSGSSVSQAPLR